MTTEERVPDDLADLDRTPAAVDPVGRHHAPAAEEADDPRTDPAPVPVGALTAQATAGQNGHGVYGPAVTAQTSLPATRHSGAGDESGSFHGHITREDGRPVPGAALTLIDQRGHQVARASGSGDGGYTVAGPGPGSYVLIVSAPGHRPTAVNVAHAAHPQRMDLTLSGLGELSGTVRSTRGDAPLAGATVTVTDQYGEVVASAASGEDGTYLCHGVVPGTYTLVAVAEHMRPTATALTVPDSGRLRHDIELAPMAVLTGSARADGGRPVTDIQITVLDATGDVAATARTDEQGRYIVPDLPEGQYTVVARGYPPVTGQVAISGEEVGYDVELGYGADEQV
ncbi:carboxypeptidase-like regulatory domain-containing protein [Nocardia testacea]